MLETLKQYAARDGMRLWYREWVPASPRSAVVYVHGIQSHSGWFVRSAEALAARGHAVYSLDRRGSGRNEADRGDAKTWVTLTDDIADFFGSIILPGGPLPRHLVGISWGGKPAACFAAQRPGTVDSLALIAPGLVPRVAHSPGERVGIVLAALFWPRYRFRITIDRPEMFTRTPERIEFIRTDPLALRACTARFFIGSVKMDQFLSRRARNIRVPALMLLANDDPIVDNGLNIRMFDAFGSPQKKIQGFSNVGHTLEFERDIGFLVDALSGWIDEHSTRSPASSSSAS